MGQAYLRAGLPSHVTYTITNRCNINCQHCFLRPATKEDELSTDEIKDLLRQAAELKVLFAGFTGGEPLVRSDCIDLMREARRLAFGVSLLTNGTLIDEEMAHRIADCHPVRVQVTILGPDAAIHDATTQAPGSFDRATAAVERLCRLGANVCVVTIATSLNVDRLAEIATWARNVGAEWRIANLVTVDIEGGRAPLALRASPERLEAALCDPRLADAAGWFHDDPPEDLARDGRPREPGFCGAGTKSLSICPDGTVWPCVTLPLDCGSAKKQRLSEIWHDSPVLKRLRGLTAADFPECRECEHLEWCFRCPADALLEAGDLLGCCDIFRQLARVNRRVAEYTRQRNDRTVSGGIER